MGYYKKVKYKPWLGAEYEYGICGFSPNGIAIYGNEQVQGKKILILADNFYCEGDPPIDITEKIVKWAISEGFTGFRSIYRITKLFLDKRIQYIDFETSEIVWRHLAFYHYAQQGVKDAELAFYHYAQQGVNEDAELAFYEILEVHKPDLVIVLGDRVYNMLPESYGEYAAEVETEYGEVVEIWKYNILNKRIYVMPMTTPASRAFNLLFWKDIINRVFNLLFA